MRNKKISNCNSGYEDDRFGYVCLLNDVELCIIKTINMKIILTGSLGHIGSPLANELIESLTHIRPGYFYYNLMGFIRMIKSAGFLGSVYGGADRLAIVSPIDIARVVSEEIINLEHTNAVRYVYSDDRSCNEVAAVLGEGIGIPDLKWNILAEDQVMQSLLANGIPENTVINLIELGNATHSGILREDFEKNTPKAGKVSLEDFAKEFAAAYHQQ